MKNLMIISCFTIIMLTSTDIIKAVSKYEYQECEEYGHIANHTTDPYLINLKPKINLNYSDENKFLTAKFNTYNYMGQKFVISYSGKINNPHELRLYLYPTNADLRVYTFIRIYKSFEKAFMNNLWYFACDRLGGIGPATQEDKEKAEKSMRDFNGNIIGDYCWHSGNKHNAFLSIVKSNLSISIQAFPLSISGPESLDEEKVPPENRKENLDYSVIVTQIANDIITIIDQIPLEELKVLEINKPQDNIQDETKPNKNK